MKFTRVFIPGVLQNLADGKVIYISTVSYLSTLYLILHVSIYLHCILSYMYLSIYLREGEGEGRERAIYLSTGGGEGEGEGRERAI